MLETNENFFNPQPKQNRFTKNQKDILELKYTMTKSKYQSVSGFNNKIEETEKRNGGTGK